MNVKPTNKFQPSTLIIENKPVLSVNIIENYFSKLFTNNIDKRIGKSDKKHMTNYEKQMKIPFFFLSRTCQNDVKNIINDMPTVKACGTNSILTNYTLHLIYQLEMLSSGNK